MSRAAVVLLSGGLDSMVCAGIAAEQGYSVSHAVDGMQGLKALARTPDDLVILDFIMHGMSGAEVAKRILANKADQPILFVSGYSETDAVKSVAPQAPLIAKPFRAEALEKAVRAAMAARS